MESPTGLGTHQRPGSRPHAAQDPWIPWRAAEPLSSTTRLQGPGHATIWPCGSGGWWRAPSSSGWRPHAARPRNRRPRRAGSPAESSPPLPTVRAPFDLPTRAGRSAPRHQGHHLQVLHLPEAWLPLPARSGDICPPRFTGAVETACLQGPEPGSARVVQPTPTWSVSSRSPSGFPGIPRAALVTFPGPAVSLAAWAGRTT